MNNLKYFKIIALSIIAVTFIISIVNYTFADDEKEVKAVKKKLNSFDNSLSGNDLNDIIIEVGKSFIGTPYEAGTLDRNTDEENLVIKISGLDCVTFVENTLAIARIIKENNINFDAYRSELEKIRYRNGKVNGYTSRLHYFSDWIYDNEQKGIVKDITEDAGGLSYDKDIDFMTTHTSAYKQLQNNSNNIDEMQAIERQINKRKMYYIPKDRVDEFYDKMQSGDIIATTTNIAGLDITHTGFIYKNNGKTYFLHASITKGEIMVSKEQLKEYLKSNKKQSGIMLIRPL